MRRVSIQKKPGSTDSRPLTSLRIKIIERSILNANNKRLYGLSAILSAVNCKQIPLCLLHHLEFEAGEYSSLDKEFLKKVYNVDCFGLNFEELFLGK